ncbi:DnaJ-like, subfamily C, domain-containing protein [Caldalkalibacillus thermarum TA2.A1]|uniref:DUF1992 domain-containing protein n=1 Tax=Caldalkalibacillus thermarum (strain TA2.A1) TaxID=986075 RepID=F5L5L0_CALTT|nr:DnaJ family domain-containing protein [Caldalkalibacillus thermarum]EGL83366.1 DnaJ-like, subfamily C, domain-containing protein [Caldalkalibacillus thermarum TA2.A1]QZT32872.1 DUF1992 domain-containing protein [Caldalkalibacillus thermarum TA2.A1]
MDILSQIAEEKIREAMKKGEFDNLPGQGKPLNLEDLSRVPEDLRAGYKLLKNAGVLPEELQMQKEIINLQSLIECCYDNEQKAKMKKELNEKMLRFNLLMEKRNKTGSTALEAYQSKITNRFK